MPDRADDAPKRSQRNDVTAGKGRRDDVGKTGIYPATGPFPDGNAEVMTPGDINRPRVKHEHEAAAEDVHSRHTNSSP